jgi:hypothetical protein
VIEVRGGGLRSEKTKPELQLFREWKRLKKIESATLSG